MTTTEQCCFYDLLGVAPDATRAEIRRGYLRAAQRLHPDLNRNSEASERAFKQVHRVYELLSDPNQRCIYDEDPARFRLTETGVVVDDRETIISRPYPVNTNRRWARVDLQSTVHADAVVAPRWSSNREGLLVFIVGIAAVSAAIVGSIAGLRAHRALIGYQQHQSAAPTASLPLSRAQSDATSSEVMQPDSSKSESVHAAAHGDADPQKGQTGPGMASRNASFNSHGIDQSKSPAASRPTRSTRPVDVDDSVTPNVAQSADQRAIMKPTEEQDGSLSPIDARQPMNVSKIQMPSLPQLRIVDELDAPLPGAPPTDTMPIQPSLEPIDWSPESVTLPYQPRSVPGVGGKNRPLSVKGPAYKSVGSPRSFSTGVPGSTIHTIPATPLRQVSVATQGSEPELKKPSDPRVQQAAAHARLLGYYQPKPVPSGIMSMPITTSADSASPHPERPSHRMTGRTAYSSSYLPSSTSGINSSTSSSETHHHFSVRGGRQRGRPQLGFGNRSRSSVRPYRFQSPGSSRSVSTSTIRQRSQWKKTFQPPGARLPLRSGFASGWSR